ncbi:SGNH/GDSL hydrolase family protein [Roseivirga pacifica]|uniref:SGNH/GDSL hydrolase family protein n=1 Tax=Roseivirga pacifica TaxID=1267423 RepID=UPI003BAF7466
MKKLLKVLLINLIFLIVGLFVIEGILTFYPIRDPFKQEKISTRYYFTPTKLPKEQFTITIEDQLPGFKNYDKQVTVTTNNLGFRYQKDLYTNKKSDDEFRIFAIGGSTTECSFLNDGDDWPSLLAKQMNDVFLGKNISVINTGQSGHNISDHLHLVIQQLIHLNPDLFIVYAGVNDLYASITKSTSQNKSTYPLKVRGELLLLTETQIGRRLYYLVKGMNPNPYHITAETNQQNRAAIVSEMAFTNFPEELNFDYSLNGLEALIGICKALNIKLVFLSQAVSWDEKDTDLDSWQTSIFGNVRYREKDLRRAMDELNAHNISLCNKHNIPYINMQQELTPNSDNFFDDMHLNYQGSNNLSQVLLQFFEKNDYLLNSLNKQANPN